jgi:hypothetical protein
MQIGANVLQTEMPGSIALLFAADLKQIVAPPRHDYHRMASQGKVAFERIKKAIFPFQLEGHLQY